MSDASSDFSSGVTPTAPKWGPLDSICRRVLGVLVEKAKTTPDAYPLSMNGLITGCNQKNNRDPLMTVDEGDVETALDKLREAGAIAEVHGSGRVVKYRHYMKEWLGVDGVELAVMTELLLRGAQTVGDLRGRAARMTPGQLADVSALRPVLDGLRAKRLIQELSPPGRGQIVSHALYEPDELTYLKARVAKMVVANEAESTTSRPVAASTTPQYAPRPSVPPTTHGTASDSAAIDALRRELAEVKGDVARLKKDVEDIWESLR